MINIIGTDAHPHLFVEDDIAKFKLRETIEFTSGIKSPGVIVDNKELGWSPDLWAEVLAPVLKMAASSYFDTIAAVGTGAIMHGAVLAAASRLPFVYVSREVKERGLKKRIEGKVPDVVTGKRILLVEDQGSTGGSTAVAINALLEEGGVVTDVVFLCIYQFPEMEERLLNLNVGIHTVTIYQDILYAAIEKGKVSDLHAELIRAWLKDPWAEWSWPE